MEKRELRKRVIRLKDSKDSMKQFQSRAFMNDKEKANYMKSYYILQGRIKELELLIKEEELDDEDIIYRPWK